MQKIQTSHDQHRVALMRKLWADRSTRALILLDIRDPEVKKFLSDAAPLLNITLSETLDSDSLGGYDACITDGLGDLDLVNLVKHSVVPILPQDHALIQSFREFDPMKFEGNAFIFSSVNSYLIFEKLIRYLENIRYPGDKRTLLNNVGKTF